MNMNSLLSVALQMTEGAPSSKSESPVPSVPAKVRQKCAKR
ncbi:hypothetical protein [Piscirickettsia salmonis]|nr:hypothetical protein [Piscirickettsia salmonis]